MSQKCVSLVTSKKCTQMPFLLTMKGHNIACNAKILPLSTAFTKFMHVTYIGNHPHKKNFANHLLWLASRPPSNMPA